MNDILIIGAGVTGTLLARYLSKYELDILVIEKENDVGNVTSSANTAIIHAGYDPLPGTLKAKLNVLGNKMYDQLADELDVSFVRNGTLTVINSESQWPLFNELVERAKKNNVPVEILSKEETLKKEPNLSKDILGSLYAPTGGIINPFELVTHAMENAVDNGVNLVLNEEVISIKDFGDYFLVTTNKNKYKSKIVINAAGLYSDKIANMIEKVDWSITPKKGEYYVLDHTAPFIVSRPIFPLPSEKGKGILVSPTTSGNYLIGPSSEVVNNKDDYSTDILTLKNVKSNATSLVPNIPFYESIRVFSGLRASGSTHDFIIEHAKSNPRFINLGGIESPGLASSPAISDYVIENFVKPIISLEEKKDYNPRVRKYPRLNKMSEEERSALIKSNPDFGKIVCLCEAISLGEILDCLSRSAAPTSIKGVKRRLRTGFGKCQGGYCHADLVTILSSFYHKPISSILYDGEGSNIVIEEVKKVNND